MTTATRGRIRIESSAKRVRGYLGGNLVVDCTAAVLVWEKPYYPTYYFPAGDVVADLTLDGTAHSPSRGEAETYAVRAGGRTAPRAALRYRESPIEALRDLVRFEWDAVDAWFEEDEEVFVHPRDPYTRVDILPSSRRVRVEVDGVTVAESTNPTLLFETGLPVRYYLPKTHVRMDLLEPSDTVTHCPYKGTAQTWSVRTGDGVQPDLAWAYRLPVPESQKVAGLVAFYNEKLDIYVDDVLQERPKTHFG
ncbi:MAG: hypothetical protein DLM57_03340 [Pseudonocardiales bacterium]|nr:MAG: hypothetical protein DLM57_03340 [Pseudonocardiales bacterium]